MIYGLVAFDFILVIAIAIIYWKLNKQDKILSDRLMEDNKAFKDKIELDNKTFKAATESDNKTFKDKIELDNKTFKAATESENKTFKDKIELDNKAFKDELAKEINAKLDVFKEILLKQMYLHESTLLSESGYWVLECNGEKKSFSPGKIKSVESHPDKETKIESLFETNGENVICTTKKNGIIISEIIYSRYGGIKSGKIFRNGVIVKEFSYDEYGQVKKDKSN